LKKARDPWDSSSCLTQAQRELYGDDAEYVQVTLSLNVMTSEAHPIMEDDPDYQQGTALYDECIATHRHESGDVEQALSRNDGRGRAATRRERSGRARARP
jgi:hypothetical protein